MKDTKGTTDLQGPEIKKHLPEDEKELVKQIVVHEAYSAMYKLKLAQIVVYKGAKWAGKAIHSGGKLIKAQYDKQKEKKTSKK